MKKLIAAVTVIGLTLLSGCGSDAPASNTVTNQNPAAAETDVYIMAGKVVSDASVNVSSKISARITSLTVDKGAKVTKGQPLVYLDTQDIADQVKQASAAADAAQANLNKALNGARPEQIAQAKALLSSANSTYISAKNNLDRIKQLYQAGGASAQQLEAAQSQYASAEAAYKTAQESLNILNRGETKDTIQMLQSQANQAKAALDLVKEQQKNGVLLSPVTGTVEQKNVNAGELASPGTTLLTLVSEGALYIEAQVPTAFANQIKEGQAVKIKTAEFPDKKFEGKIAVINPVVDTKSKNITVKVEVSNDGQLLKPGMYAEIALKK